MNLFKSFQYLWLLVILAQCTSDGSENLGISSEINNASAKMEIMFPESTTVTSNNLITPSPLKSRAVGFAEGFTTVGLAPTSDLGPDFFYAIHGDRSVEDSISFQFRQNVEQDMCIFTYSLPSTNGFPDLRAESTLTITEAMFDSNNGTSLEAACPLVFRGDIPDRPFDVLAEVIDVSNLPGSQYDRLLTFTIDGDVSRFYYRKNETLTRLAYFEDRASETDSSTFFEFNQLTNITKYEYIRESDSFRFIQNLVRFATNRFTNAPETTALIVTKIASQISPQVAVSYSFDNPSESLSLPMISGCLQHGYYPYTIAESDTTECEYESGKTILGSNSTEIENLYTKVADDFTANGTETSVIQFTNENDILSANPP